MNALDTVIGRAMLVRAEPGKNAQKLIDAGFLLASPGQGISCRSRLTSRCAGPAGTMNR